MYQPDADVGHDLRWEALEIAGFVRNGTMASLREIVWRDHRSEPQLNLPQQPWEGPRAEAEKEEQMIWREIGNAGAARAKRGWRSEKQHGRTETLPRRDPMALRSF